MSFLALTDAGAQRMLENFLGINDAFGTGAWMALFTANPTSAGGGTEAVGYSRGNLDTWTITTTAGTSSGLLTVSGGIASAPAATVTAWGLFDTEVGGTLLAYCILDTAVTLAAGDAYLFAANDLIIGFSF